MQLVAIQPSTLLTSPAGLDKVEGLLGKKTGHNVDPNKMRSTNEKIVSHADLWKWNLPEQRETSC
jgi:hypothetical protein